MQPDDVDSESGPASWLADIARVSEVGRVATEVWDPGTTLCEGRFEVLSILGQGGMGAVYAVHDRHLGAERALKTLRSDRPELRRRFKREFRSLQGFDHPNLVSLDELHIDGDRMFFTMERVRGVPFDEWVRPGGVLDPGRLEGASEQLVEALRALHRRDRAHCDVKPSNVLVEATGRLVLLDLGLVATLGSSQGPGGTLAYAAPEQLAGAPVRPEVDWYALGTILYEALTGSLPFGSHADEIVEAKRSGSRATLDHPHPWTPMVRRLLDPSPEVRSPAPELGFEPVADVGLIGREREIRRVRHWVRSGSRGVLAILGTSGIGKTALLRAVAGEVRGTGATVFEGACRQNERIPFQALDALLDGPNVHELPAGLGSLDEASVDLNDDGVARRREVHAAFRRYFEARQRPSVFLDDVQWLDEDSADVLDSLLAEPACIRLVITGRRLPRLRASLRVEALSDLHRDGARALASARLGPEHLTMVDSVVARAKGSPFLIERMSAAVLHDDSVGSQGVLGALDALPAEERSLLRWVCACGGASLPVIRELLDASDDFGTRVARLRAAGWLSVERGRLEVSHSELRAALESTTTLDEYRRLAETTARVEPTAHADLARHWEHAGDALRSSRHYERAAEGAQRVGALVQAARAYADARRLDPSDRARAHRLSRACASAFVAAGRSAEAAPHLLLAAADTVPEDRSLRLAAANAWLRAGHIDEGLAVVESLADAAGLSLPQSTGGVVAALVAEKIRHALSMTPGATDGDVEAMRLCRALGMGLALVDPGLSALFQTRYARMAQTCGSAEDRALAACLEAVPLATGGPPAKRAYAKLAKARALAAGLVSREVAVHVELAEAGVAFLTGDFRRSLTSCDAVRVSLDGDGGRAAWELATTERYALACLWHLGRLPELRLRTLAAMDSARDRGDLYATTQLQTTVLPVVLLMGDRPADAFVALKEAERRWSTRKTFLQHWQHGQALALVHLYRGTPEVARHWLRRHDRVLARALTGRIQAVRVFSAAVRALLALGEFAIHRRRGCLRDANEHARVLDAEEGAVAFAAFVKGQIAVAQGRLPEARALFRASSASASSEGMELVAACAREGLGEGGLDSWLLAHGVVRPDRFRRIMAPMIAPEGRR